MNQINSHTSLNVRVFVKLFQFKILTLQTQFFVLNDFIEKRPESTHLDNQQGEAWQKW